MNRGRTPRKRKQHIIHHKSSSSNAADKEIDAGISTTNSKMPNDNIITPYNNKKEEEDHLQQTVQEQSTTSTTVSNSEEDDGEPHEISDSDHDDSCLSSSSCSSSGNSDPTDQEQKLPRAQQPLGYEIKFSTITTAAVNAISGGGERTESSSAGRATASKSEEQVVSANRAGRRDQGGDDDESSSVSSCSTGSSSQSSLFSAYTYMDEESTIASCYKGEARLRKHFEKRDRRLNKMLIGKRKMYEISLLQQEQAVRQYSIESFKLQRKQQQQSGKNNSSVELGLSFTTQLWHNLVLFESHHSVRGLLIISMYCLSSAAFYFMLDILMNHLYQVVFANLFSTSTYYVMLFAMSVGTMRLTGYLFEWTDRETFEFVKFEMHNREKLGYFDARIRRYFRHTSCPTRKRMQSYLNFFSFYIAYYAVLQLHYNVITNVLFPPIEAWYKSNEASLIDVFEEQDIPFTSATCDSYLEFSKSIRNMSETTAMIQYQLCTDKEWQIVQNAYHLVLFCITVGAYETFGLKFIECCD